MHITYMHLYNLTQFYYIFLQFYASIFSKEKKDCDRY